MRINTAILTSLWILTAGLLFAEDGQSSKYDKTVEKIENQLSVARSNLAKKLDQLKSKIKDEKLPPDQKRILIEEVTQQISKFRESNTVPDHPYLLSASFAFAVSSNPLMINAIQTRQKIIEASLRAETLAEQNELKALEKRITLITSDASDWREGAVWKGTRTYPDGTAQNIRLNITKVVGNEIEGTIRQSYDNGNSDIMNIVGIRTGSMIDLKTTAMKLGKGRSLSFQGYLIGQKLIAQVSGVAASGKPANGIVCLTSD